MHGQTPGASAHSLRRGRVRHGVTRCRSTRVSIERFCSAREGPRGPLPDGFRLARDEDEQPTITGVMQQGPQQVQNTNVRTPSTCWTIRRRRHCFGTSAASCVGTSGPSKSPQMVDGHLSLWQLRNRVSSGNGSSVIFSKEPAKS